MLLQHIAICDLMRKLKKINRRARDPTRGICDSHIQIDKIFMCLGTMISNREHACYDLAIQTLIEILSTEWHERLRYCAYCYLTSAENLEHVTTTIIRHALCAFRNDVNNREIITKANRLMST